MRVYRVMRGRGSLAETRGRSLNLGRVLTWHGKGQSASHKLEERRRRKDMNLMEVANESSRKGASPGNIHARARCLFS